MTLTNSSRKRECSQESEYLPVTKRLNNLHINVSTNELNDSTIIGQQTNRLEFGLDNNQINQNYGFVNQQNQCHNSMNGMNGVIVSNIGNNCYNSSKDYSPELNSNENPIYYESNRILYEAHQQRILRINVITRDLLQKS